MAEDTDIAIVGIGCRLPGADNLKEFWRILVNGENHVVDIPPDRWHMEGFYDPDPNAPGKSYVKKAGLVNGLEYWDNDLFGINDVEAKAMDPQQRLVLDCVHMALENGGITRSDLDGSLTGVYIGAMNDDFSGVADESSMASNYKVTGTQRSIISARVSYVYNLHGPALTVDTACSSSLVAIHIGSQALRLGECNAAICGGVNCLLAPTLFVALSKARMLSPTGQCQAFTDQADGYARAEGCGIVILKRLNDALRDENEIWGIVKTATNQDGHMTTPITAPSGKQQVALLEHIYSHFNVEKDRMQVIEAHGTGTAIGDPTEANALGSFFDTTSSKIQERIFIGSVKTNIGHLESAAGVAGLIKVLLMLKHKVIVPSLMYSVENENPTVNLAKFGLVVPTTCQDWTRKSGHRMACVNSFGFGGTNAHAIISEFPSDRTIFEHKPYTYPNLVVLSADTKQSLVRNIISLKDALVPNADDEDVRSIAFTSQKRDHNKYRKAFAVRSTSDLRDKLVSSLETQFLPAKKRSVNFVFCGVGTVWSGMCKEMMTIPIFSKAIGEVDSYLKIHTGWSVFDIFRKGFSEREDPMKSHFAIFACQVGLDALWKAIGVVPTAVVGQSVGEVAAAYSAGYMDLRSAVDVIYYRSAVLAKVKNGTMIVVKNIDIHEIEMLCSKKKNVSIAVFHSPKSCTIAGSADEIHDICSDIAQTFTAAVVIHLDAPCAYHSKYVAEAAENIGIELEKVQINVNAAKSAAFFSTVTGKYESYDVVNSGQYWRKNVQMPVRFGEAVEKSTEKQENTIFLEIGPTPVLKPHLNSIFVTGESTPLSFPSMTKGKETQTFIGTLCTLYELGMNANWKAVYPFQSKLCSLPTYSFAKKTCPLPKAFTTEKCSAASNSLHLFMDNATGDNGDPLICLTIDKAKTAFVFQHRVKKYVVVPGAMYADAAFFIGASCFSTKEQNLEISLDFLSPLTLTENAAVNLQCKVRPLNESVIEFVVKDGCVAKCKGKIKRSMKARTQRQSGFNAETIERRLCQEESKTFNQNEIYSCLETYGFQYGPCFRMLESCVATCYECLVDMIVPELVWSDVNKTTIHPCILDCVIQSTFFGFNINKKTKMSLPAGIESIHIYRQPEREMKVYCKRTKITDMETMHQLHFDMYVLNHNDDIIFTVNNFTSYFRKEGWKVPLELVYDVRLLPFEAKIEAQRHVNNLIVLTDEQNEERLEILYSTKHIRKVLMLSQLNTLDVHMKELGPNDVIILMLSDKKTRDELSSPLKIYERVRSNCWILTQLVQSLMRSTVSVPLVVTTQNTQHFSSDECTGTINIFGSEVWGFTRSAQIEFALKNLLLVDLQDPLKASLDTFLSYMISRPKDASDPREIIIRESHLFYPDLHKIPKTTICPGVRSNLMMRQCRKEATNGYVVLQNRNNKPAFVCIYRDTPTSKNISSDTTEVFVQDVFLHPPNLFAETEITEGGDILVGIEYTAIKVDKANAFMQCKKQTVAHDELNLQNKHQHVVVFPAKVQPFLQVPRACKIRKTHIPNYKPGLLVYALIFWEMVQRVPHESTCKILQGNTPFVNILKSMLFQVKKAKFTDMNEGANMDEGKRNVMILLTRKQKVLKEIWHASVVIALPKLLSDNQIKMLGANACKLIECGFENVLSEKKVPKHLHTVVKWLQKNQKLLSNDTGVILPHIQIAKGDAILLPCKPYCSNLFDEDGVYVVTGGLTGLGWEIVQLILEKGARKIVTLSRREKSTEQSMAIMSMSQKQKCSIVHIPTDTSNLESVRETFGIISHTVGTIKGIFHCAGVLDSKSVITMDFAALEKVLKPKVLGALNIHFATQLTGLTHFQLVSSISSIIGTPGQANYGAANNFLDAFAIYLRQNGVCCQSVRWGALDLGMVKENKMEDFFKRRGHRLLSIPEIRSCVEFQLLTNVSSLIFADLDWNTIARDHFNPQMKTLVHRLQTSIEDNITKDIKETDNEFETTVFIREELVDADVETQMTELQRFILNASTKINQSDEDVISLATKLSDVGYDSMSALTFVNVVNDATGCRIPFDMMEDEVATFRDLVEYLHAHIFCDNGI